MTPGKVIRILIAVVAICLGSYAVYLVYSGQDLPFISGALRDPSQQVVTQAQTPTDLSEYTWEQISEISNKIAAAPSDEEGRKIAQSYNLIDEQGNLTNSEVAMQLTDGSVISVQLVGIRHDDKSDGSGKAGLTFMTKQAIALHPINSERSVEGGWEASQMRSWLSKDGVSLFPKEVQDAMVSVNKMANNVGFANGDTSVVSSTSDKLWLFSVKEVCGNVGWFAHEYGEQYAYLDAVINAEGEQYERFRTAGITGTQDPDGSLRRGYQGSACDWWYRSAFSYKDGIAIDDWFYFYKVMSTGYPYSSGLVTDSIGVVVGFCV